MKSYVSLQMLLLFCFIHKIRHLLRIHSEIENFNTTERSDCITDRKQIEQLAVPFHYWASGFQTLDPGAFDRFKKHVLFWTFAHKFGSHSIARYDDNFSFPFSDHLLHSTHQIESIFQWIFDHPSIRTTFDFDSDHLTATT